ncbi:hypothetical protein PTQ35_05320 [Campylobacter sp. 46490-21]|uniref:hypothetical protein n=1 Tax=Campylobacter magnus TaxID=3026462 RepID=UPI0023611F92|nr:hypothetical protein [Campylobacter magnus]MDD0848235.1 hypothetical protein [Campylobacter magnus]
MLDLTYDEAIEQIMLKNGGFASLKQLYNDIWLLKIRIKLVEKHQITQFKSEFKDLT